MDDESILRPNGPQKRSSHSKKESPVGKIREEKPLSKNPNNSNRNHMKDNSACSHGS
jgi:hypothetical protein